MKFCRERELFDQFLTASQKRLPLGLQAFKLGQHPFGGTGAGVPSGQIFKSSVQKTFWHIFFGLHALYDGQHSPGGTGAGVPSGQIFRSNVQPQFIDRLHALSDGQHPPGGTGARVPSGQIFESKPQRAQRQSLKGAIQRIKWNNEIVMQLFQTMNLRDKALQTINGIISKQRRIFIVVE